MNRETKEEYTLNQLVLENNINNESFVRQIDLFIMDFLHKNYPTLCTKRNKEIFDELVSAGWSGMMEAKLRYDPEKGKYCTYARMFLRGEVRRAYNSSVLHLPDYYAREYKKLKKAKDYFLKMHGGSGKKLTIELWHELSNVRIKTIKTLMLARPDLVSLV